EESLEALERFHRPLRKGDGREVGRRETQLDIPSAQLHREGVGILSWAGRTGLPRRLEVIQAVADQMADEESLEGRQVPQGMFTPTESRLPPLLVLLGIEEVVPFVPGEEK